MNGSYRHWLLKGGIVITYTLRNAIAEKVNENGTKHIRN